MWRGLLTFGLLPVATAFFGSLALIASVLAPRSNAVMRLGRPWSRLLLACAGVRPRYDGLHFAALGHPVVFASNHLSIVDIWALIPVLPLETKFVAKRSLFRFPIFGRAMRAGGFIAIDRDRFRDAVASLGVAVERIREGDSVIVFVEGTRSPDGSLRRFKKGAFRLAAQADVPIVPVSIRGTFGVVRPRSLRVTPGPVEVTFHAPVAPATTADGDVTGWMAEVRGVIARAVGEVSAEPPVEPAQRPSISAR